jgi:hypothetical protein
MCHIDLLWLLILYNLDLFLRVGRSERGHKRDQASNFIWVIGAGLCYQLGLIHLLETIKYQNVLSEV